MRSVRSSDNAVRRFLQLVADAFQGWNSSSISEDELWSGLVRLILRTVFLMVAEQREMLPVHHSAYRNGYGIGWWIRSVEKSDRLVMQQRYSGWARLQSAGRLLYHGSSHPRLPVPAYGSELLRPAVGHNDDGSLPAILETMPGPNDAQLASVLRGLWRMLEESGAKQHQSDALGEVYQQLLDLKAVVPKHEPWVCLRLPGAPWIPESELDKQGVLALRGAHEKSAQELVRATAAPGEIIITGRWNGKRGGGRYYTPNLLVKPLVEQLIRPLCQDASGVRTPEAILELKILDPAMGSGAFLVEVLRELATALQKSVLTHNRLSGSTSVDSRSWTGATQVNLTQEIQFELPLGPGEPGFRELLDVYLRRFVVEHCLYGVDIDPTAVETARLSLWLETMDSSLPLTFLDHRLRPGNSLFGADLEMALRYPESAWSNREGSAGNPGIQRINSELRTMKKEQQTPVLPFPNWRESSIRASKQLHNSYRELQSIPVQWPGKKQYQYSHRIKQNPTYCQLKERLDLWCALWVWPDEQSQLAPGPQNWLQNGPIGAYPLLDSLREGWGFFHFPLEFPDAFASDDPACSGFDVVVTNPPWEIPKPDLNEFLSRHSPILPLLRSKQASSRRTELLQQRRIREEYDQYIARMKHWQRWVAFRHEAQEEPTTGSEAIRPFSLQKNSDFNLFKLFIEQALWLLKPHGRLGMVTPSSVYSDRSTCELRRYFLKKCRWEWLWGFDNRERIFPIDSRFKFCAVLLEKGSTTDALKLAFPAKVDTNWSAALEDPVHLPMPLLQRLNPNTLAVPELSVPKDAALLDILTRNGSSAETDWEIRYQRELDLSRPATRARLTDHPEVPVYQSVSPVLVGGNLHLPVIQGATFVPYRWNGQRWAQGRWRSAKTQSVWRSRYALPVESCPTTGPEDVKVVVRRIARNSDTRTVIAALAPSLPCDDKAPTLRGRTLEETLGLLVVLNSFVFDYMARRVSTGTNLDRHRLLGVPLPDVEEASNALWLAGASLGAGDVAFAPLWLRLRETHPGMSKVPWEAWWNPGQAGRRRIRIWAEVTVARLYGLDSSELQKILADCHHPRPRLAEPVFTGTLDARGFWRVDRSCPPARRLTMQVLRAMEREPEGFPFRKQSGKLLDWEDCAEMAATLQQAASKIRRASGRLV